MHAMPVLKEADAGQELQLTPVNGVEATPLVAGVKPPHNTPLVPSTGSGKSSSPAAAESVVGGLQRSFSAAIGPEGRRAAANAEHTSPARPVASAVCSTGNEQLASRPAAAAEPISPLRPANPSPFKASIVQSPLTSKRRFGAPSSAAAAASPAPKRSCYKSPLKALGLSPSKIVTIDPEAPLQPNKVSLVSFESRSLQQANVHCAGEKPNHACFAC